MKSLALVLLALAIPAGEKAVRDQKNAAPGDMFDQVAAAPTSADLYRFTITRDASVAFDTRTGQICRTWEWKPVGRHTAPDPATGGLPQQQRGESVPTCLSLYLQYSGSPDDRRVVEEQLAAPVGGDSFVPLPKR